VSVGSTSPCDCSPKSPKRMRSSRDPRADAKQGIGTRVQFGGHPPSHAQWRARLCDRGRGQVLVSVGPTCREFPGASQFEEGIRVSAWFSVYSTR